MRLKSMGIIAHLFAEEGNAKALHAQRNGDFRLPPLNADAVLLFQKGQMAFRRLELQPGIVEHVMNLTERVSNPFEHIQRNVAVSPSAYGRQDDRVHCPGLSVAVPAVNLVPRFQERALNFKVDAVIRTASQKTVQSVVKLHFHPPIT